MNDKDDDSYYEEIKLPTRRISHTGGRYIITIPLRVVKKHQLRRSLHVEATLFIKRKNKKEQELLITKKIEIGKEKRII